MPQDASDKIYDLAVIGAGIAGAAIARDAAMRGLGVVVFEKNTAGSGTSSKSSKLIHGGLRYLETAWRAFLRSHFREAWKNLRFVFNSLRECRVLGQIAPELIKPLPLVIPIYKGNRNRFVVYAGSFLYYFLSLAWGGGKTPRIFWSRKSVLAHLPALNPDGLIGGILIWDRLTEDRKLVEAVMRSAQAAGAELFEHAPVTGYARDREKHFYRVNATQNGTAKTYLCRKLVNASGPWVDKVSGKKYLHPVAGAHIVFPKFLPISAILQAEDNRIFFVINIDGFSRVGTTEREEPNPDRVKVTDEEKNYLLRSLKKYFPGMEWKKENIVGEDAGVRPLVRPTAQVAPSDISREHAFRVDEEGVIHVLGVKLTDHRRAAQELVDKLIPEFLREHPNLPRHTRTHLEPLN